MNEIIRTECPNDRLILYVNTKITSDNAAQFKQEVDAAKLQPHTFAEVDLSGAEYISSAGLRVILSLYRSEKEAGRGGDQFLISGANATVYETMEITGFTDMMNVRRMKHRISLENAELIGEGFNSKVYRVDQENIVKVFIHDESEEEIQHELDLAKYAFVQGIPTAISFDIVDVEGKKGVMFEMMNTGSLRDYVRDDTSHLDEHLDKYAALLKELHSTRDKERRLPDARLRMLRHLEENKGSFTAEEYARISALANELPEKDIILHGDCHLKNIMLHNGEPVLIDLDTLSRGDPVIELGNIYYAYHAFEAFWPGNNEAFFGIPQSLINQVMDGVMDRYFAGQSAEKRARNMDRVRFASDVRMMHFLMRNKPEEKEVLRKVAGDLVEISTHITSLALDMA